MHGSSLSCLRRTTRTLARKLLPPLLLLLLLPQPAPAACVVLLHGLARTERSMQKLARALIKENFTTINRRYPSRAHPIEILAEETIPPALAQCPAEEEVNFVTHSLGGILLRQYLSRHEIPRLNRVVMLGPPNQGSEVVDKLGNFPGFHFINGEAGRQLGTGAASLPNRLGPADFDVGIIAGTRSINLILSRLIPGPDDGKVAVARTRLEGMHDHLEMAVTHPFMMRNERVIAQVVHYLKFGRFNREKGR